MTGLPQETKDYVHALNPSTAFAQPTPGETMHRLLRSANPAPASNTTVSVGTVNVHTQATDAKGISVDIHQAIVDSWVQQANRGLN